MAGVTFTVRIDDSDAAAELSALVARMDERRGFYSAIGQLLADSARGNFRKQSAPDGSPWQPLKPSTIRKRTRNGQLPIRILQSNSKTRGAAHSGSSLLASINFEADNDAATIGVPEAKAKYGAIHQFGGTINMPGRRGRIYRHFDPGTHKFGRRFVSPGDPDAVAAEVDIPAYTINMPARPFLGVSPEDEGEIILLAQDWLGL